MATHAQACGDCLRALVFAAVLASRSLSSATTLRACRLDITQPVLGPSDYARVQGAGWLEGDFDRVAYPSYPAGTVANLTLALNTTAATAARLVPLSVVVSLLATGVPLAGTTAIAGDGSATSVGASLREVPVGEHRVLVAPDEESEKRGWCGSFVRFLRVHDLDPDGQVPVMRAPRAPRALQLRPRQPIVFYDDYFVETRLSLLRRVVPPVQTRIANSTWLAGRGHPWQKVSRGMAFNATSGELGFGLAMNFGNVTPPVLDPAAEHFDCALSAMPAAGSSAGAWSCRAVSAAHPTPKGNSKGAAPAPAPDGTGEVGGLRQPDRGDRPLQARLALAAAGAAKFSPDSRRMATRAATLMPPRWPPHARQPVWPLSSTVVRRYAHSDGAVNLSALSVYYTHGPEHYVTGSHDIRLRGDSGYPIWQRAAASSWSEISETKETLLLPVDGVDGRPLLHCDSLCADASEGCPVANLTTRTQVCRDPDNCHCYGPNVTDIGCANDNFGGSWLLPQSDSGHNGAASNGSNASFVYVQGRRISAFAPHAAGYDNLAQIRRVLVTWQTRDGLTWTQRWWGGHHPADPAEGGQVSVYGCVESMNTEIRPHDD